MNYMRKGLLKCYHNFCVVLLSEKTRFTLKGFPCADEAIGILVYGYYDRSAGLTLEILAAVTVEGNQVVLVDKFPDTRAMIRIEVVKNEEILYYPDENKTLSMRYKEKIDMLDHYEDDEVTKAIRQMEFLDDCRHEVFIDDVVVNFIKDGYRTEGCWVTIKGLDIENRKFKGILLNEPDQDFGCHVNDEITFFTKAVKDGRIICIADFN